MKYNFKGKTINIPDNDLQRSMDILNISKEEAIQLWLEDEGYENNEEVEEMTKKAKQNKATQKGIYNKSEKEKKSRKPKENPTKESIINKIYESLANWDKVLALEITNKTKYIEFELENKHFTVNLVEKREKK